MKPFFHRTNRDNRFGPLVAQFEYERPPLGNQQRPAAGRREKLRRRCDHDIRSALKQPNHEPH